MAGSKVILSHTTDVKIRISANALPELFLLGLKSLNQLLGPDGIQQQHTASVKVRIELESPDTTSLLIDFLSEVLTMSQVHKAIFFNFEIDEITDCKISGMLRGLNVEVFDKDVKAITYHESDVKVNEKGKWETVIIFDI